MSDRLSSTTCSSTFPKSSEVVFGSLVGSGLRNSSVTGYEPEQPGCCLARALVLVTEAH